MFLRPFVLAIVTLVTLVAHVHTNAQTADAPKPNSDAVYQKLRQQAASDFTGEAFAVKDLSLRREGVTFRFISGEIHFAPPVEGRTVGAVFLGEGEMTFAPPSNAERHSLSILAGHPVLVERFSRLVMRFSDQTLAEVKQSSNAQSITGAQSGQARDAYRDNQSFLRKEIRYNLELRTLGDVYANQRRGFFMAFLGGGRFERLFYVFDPLGIPEVYPEEVALYSFDKAERGIWAAFPAAGSKRRGEPGLYDITHHDIGATIRGTKLTASDRITLTAVAQGTRVLPLELYRSLRVSRVVDEHGHDLNFIQESKDEDADLAIILPQPLQAGQTYKFTVQYEGDEAVRDSGGGNYILIPRSTWFPNNAEMTFGDRARFDLTFRFPKDQIFVGVGSPSGAEVVEGDFKLAKWSSGDTELAVAGFNYGKFIKKELSDSETGYEIEFYANKEVPDELKELEHYLDSLAQQRVYITGITGKFTTAGMAQVALNDTQNASRIYSAYFGKLPYKRIAMTQQPAYNFGQAWPTLIYMPYFAFIDSTQRTQLLGARSGADSFWRYVGPHETAHQWWGHLIGWQTYRDQWMSEGFAEFSTSLYVQYVRKDIAKFLEFWEAQRKLIIEATPLTKGKKPYTIGPVTQGYRLNSEKTGSVARAMIYPKGAYILHMIRMMMYDHRGGGDARFREMMSDFVKSNFNKNASTEDFQRAVEKHMTPQMDLDRNGSMSWFFESWVYGMDVPAYRFEYQTGTANGQPTMSVLITQSGVSDQFRTLVPIYADFGKGWTRLGAAKLVGNTSVEIPSFPVPQHPKRVTLSAMADVLYTSLDGGKK